MKKNFCVSKSWQGIVLKINPKTETFLAQIFPLHESQGEETLKKFLSPLPFIDTTEIKINRIPQRERKYIKYYAYFTWDVGHYAGSKKIIDKFYFLKFKYQKEDFRRKIILLGIDELLKKE